MPKLYYHFSLLILSFLLSTASCKNSGPTQSEPAINTDFITLDEKPDSLSPAGIIELQFGPTGSKIYGFEYAANGPGPHPTLLFLHGMPGNERNLDIAQNLRRAGYNVVYFNYRGTWGSAGKYNFANSLNDIDSVLNYVTHPQHSKDLKVDTNRIALLGHSMGAGLALINGIANPRVKAIIALSVFNPYTTLQGKEATGNLLGLKEYISTLGMLNTDANTFLKSMLLDINRYNVEKLVAGTTKPLLIIDEHKNNDYLSKYAEKPNLNYQIWDTDHAFTNRRIALSVELNSWLNKNLR